MKNKPKQKVAETRPVELTLDELKFLRQAVEYHESCWGSMYAKPEADLVKALLKKLPEAG